MEAASFSDNGGSCTTSEGSWGAREPNRRRLATKKKWAAERLRDFLKRLIARSATPCGQVSRGGGKYEKDWATPRRKRSLQNLSLHRIDRISTRKVASRGRDKPLRGERERSARRKREVLTQQLRIVGRASRWNSHRKLAKEKRVRGSNRDMTASKSASFFGKGISIKEGESAHRGSVRFARAKLKGGE